MTPSPRGLFRADNRAQEQRFAAGFDMSEPCSRSF
jgi:hypothetical protein